jgi:uncharacterized small protein (DUF1192 family)
VTQSGPREGRPDTDDYDLLTYGEASARLTALLAAEQERLAALLAQDNPERRLIDQLETRIALLKSSDARYRRQSLSAEVFTERFGFSSPDDSGLGPR